MESAILENKKVNKKGLSLSYPSKKTVNFVEDNTGKYNKISIIGFVIFMIALVIFTKFGVIDTLSKINSLESTYNSTMSTINEYNQKLSSYSEIEAKYNDLVGNYLTESEQLSTSRVQIINMLNKDFDGFDNIVNYTISGQNVTVYTSPMTLADVSKYLNVLQNDSSIIYATCKRTIYDSNDSSLVHGEFEITYDTTGGNK